MSAIMRFLFGDRDRTKQQSVLSPEQQNLAKSLFGGLGGGGIYGQGQQGYESGMNYLQNLYSDSPDAYNKLAAPYLRQFNEQIVPGLAERFTGAGYGGRQSSAFQQSLGQAGQRLQEGLGSMFEGLKSQNLGNLLGFSNLPFQQAQGALGQRTFENIYQPGSTGIVGGGLEGLAGGAGQAGGILGILKLFGLI